MIEVMERIAAVIVLVRQSAQEVREHRIIHTKNIIKLGVYEHSTYKPKFILQGRES